MSNRITIGIVLFSYFLGILFTSLPSIARAEGHVCHISPFSQEITQGESVVYVVNLVPSVPDSQFEISTGNLPTGTTATLSQTSGVAPASPLLTLTTVSGSQIGSFSLVIFYTETITGVSATSICQFNLIVTQGKTMVDVDIKPGSPVNGINRRSRGLLPVAVFSSSSFDSTTIVQETVQFAGAAPSLIERRVKDINHDGLPDVIFLFFIQALNLPHGISALCIEGETTGGILFEGCDTIRLLPG